jgi:hypothetical protein
MVRFVCFAEKLKPIHHHGLSDILGCVFVFNCFLVSGKGSCANDDACVKGKEEGVSWLGWQHVCQYA